MNDLYVSIVATYRSFRRSSLLNNSLLSPGMTWSSWLSTTSNSSTSFISMTRGLPNLWNITHSSQRTGFPNLSLRAEIIGVVLCLDAGIASPSAFYLKGDPYNPYNPYNLTHRRNNAKPLGVWLPSERTHNSRYKRHKRAQKSKRCLFVCWPSRDNITWENL